MITYKYKIVQLKEKPFKDKWFIKKKIWITPFYRYVKVNYTDYKHKKPIDNRLTFNTQEEAVDTIKHWLEVDNTKKCKKIYTDWYVIIE